MPHLSPMMWISVALILWFILFSIMSTIWWHQSSQFPNIYNLIPKVPTSLWHWS